MRKAPEAETSTPLKEARRKKGPGPPRGEGRVGEHLQDGAGKPLSRDIFNRFAAKVDAATKNGQNLASDIMRVLKSRRVEAREKDAARRREEEEEAARYRFRVGDYVDVPPNQLPGYNLLGGCGKVTSRRAGLSGNFYDVKLVVEGVMRRDVAEGLLRPASVVDASRREVLPETKDEIRAMVRELAAAKAEIGRLRENAESVEDARSRDRAAAVRARRYSSAVKTESAVRIADAERSVEVAKAELQRAEATVLDLVADATATAKAEAEKRAEMNTAAAVQAVEAKAAARLQLERERVKELGQTARRLEHATDVATAELLRAQATVLDLVAEAKATAEEEAEIKMATAVEATEAKAAAKLKVERQKVKQLEKKAKNLEQEAVAATAELHRAEATVLDMVADAKATGAEEAEKKAEIERTAAVEAVKAKAEEKLKVEVRKRKSAEKAATEAEAKRHRAEACAAVTYSRVSGLEARIEQQQGDVESLESENQALADRIARDEAERRRQRKAAATRRRKKKNENARRRVRRLESRLASARHAAAVLQAARGTFGNVLMVKSRKTEATRSHVTNDAAVAFLSFRDKAGLSGAKLPGAVQAIDLFRTDGLSFNLRPPSRTTVYALDELRLYVHLKQSTDEMLTMLRTGKVGVLGSADLTSIGGEELMNSAFVFTSSVVKSEGEADIDGLPMYDSSAKKYENPLLALGGKTARDLAEAVLAQMKLRRFVDMSVTVETTAANLPSWFVAWVSDQGSENVGGWRNARFNDGDGGMIAQLFVLEEGDRRRRLVSFQSCLQHDPQNLDHATQSSTTMASGVESVSKFLREGKRQKQYEPIVLYIAGHSETPCLTGHGATIIDELRRSVVVHPECVATIGRRFHAPAKTRFGTVATAADDQENVRLPLALAIIVVEGGAATYQQCLEVLKREPEGKKKAARAVKWLTNEVHFFHCRLAAIKHKLFIWPIMSTSALGHHCAAPLIGGRFGEISRVRRAISKATIVFDLKALRARHPEYYERLLQKLRGKGAPDFEMPDSFSLPRRSTFRSVFDSKLFAQSENKIARANAAPIIVRWMRIVAREYEDRIGRQANRLEMLVAATAREYSYRLEPATVPHATTTGVVARADDAVPRTDDDRADAVPTPTTDDDRADDAVPTTVPMLRTDDRADARGRYRWREGSPRFSLEVVFDRSGVWPPRQRPDGPRPDGATPSSLLEGTCWSSVASLNDAADSRVAPIPPLLHKEQPTTTFPTWLEVLEGRALCGLFDELSDDDRASCPPMLSALLTKGGDLRVMLEEFCRGDVNPKTGWPWPLRRWQRLHEHMYAFCGVLFKTTSIEREWAFSVTSGVWLSLKRQHPFLNRSGLVEPWS